MLRGIESDGLSAASSRLPSCTGGSGNVPRGWQNGGMDGCLRLVSPAGQPCEVAKARQGLAARILITVEVGSHPCPDGSC